MAFYIYLQDKEKDIVIDYQSFILIATDATNATGVIYEIIFLLRVVSYFTMPTDNLGLVLLEKRYRIMFLPRWSVSPHKPY